MDNAWSQTIADVLQKFAHDQQATLRSSRGELRKADWILLPEVHPFSRNEAMKGGIAVLTTESYLRVAPLMVRPSCTAAFILPGFETGPSLTTDTPLNRLESELWGLLERAAEPDRVTQAMAMAKRLDSRSLSATTATLTLAREARLANLADHFPRILNVYLNGSSRTLFGLVTAIGRMAGTVQDTRLRWSLEEFGGRWMMHPPEAHEIRTIQFDEGLWPEPQGHPISQPFAK